MYNTFKYEVFFTSTHTLDLVFIKLGMNLNPHNINQLHWNGVVRSICEIKYIKKLVVALTKNIDYLLRQIELPNNFEELDMSSMATNIIRMKFPLSIKKMKLYITNYLPLHEARDFLANLALNENLKDIIFNKKHKTVLDTAKSELKYPEEIKFE